MTGERSQFIPVGATFYHVVPDGRGVEWIAKPKDGDDARWEFITPMATAMRAVNAHDALVAACEAAEADLRCCQSVLADIAACKSGAVQAAIRLEDMTGSPNGSIFEKIHAALALAKGGER